VAAEAGRSARHLAKKYDPHLLPWVQRFELDFNGPLASPEGGNCPDVLPFPPPRLFFLLAFLPLLELVPLRLDSFVESVLIEVVELPDVAGLVGIAGRKEADGELVFELEYLIGSEVDVHLPSAVRVPPEAIIPDVDLPLVVLPELHCLLELVFVPPIVGEKSIGVVVELIVLAIQTVLIANYPISSRDAVVPNDRRVGDKLVHFGSKELEPFFKGSYRQHLSLDVDEVPIKLALLSDRHQEKRKLL